MKADKFPKWFYDNNTVIDFENGLEEFKGKKNLKFLQIGVFTGNASAWLLKNILTDPSSKDDLVSDISIAFHNI